MSVAHDRETRSTRACRRRAARPRRRRRRRRSRSSGSGIGAASASSVAASISAATSARSASTSTPSCAQPRLLTVDRVALAPLLDLLLGHVLHVVVGGVAVHPHRHRLDQRRARRRRAPARAPREPPRTSPRRRCRRRSRRRTRTRRRARPGRPRTACRAASSTRTGCSRARTRPAASARRPSSSPRGSRRARSSRRRTRSSRSARSPRSLNAIAIPVATSIMSGSIETIPTHPRWRSPKWTLPSRPRGDAGLAAQVLGEDPRRRDAADDVGGEVAVQDAQPVLRRHRERGAGRHRLLAEAVVERAGTLPWR